MMFPRGSSTGSTEGHEARAFFSAFCTRSPRHLSPAPPAPHTFLMPPSAPPANSPPTEGGFIFRRRHRRSPAALVVLAANPGWPAISSPSPGRMLTFEYLMGFLIIAPSSGCVNLPTVRSAAGQSCYTLIFLLTIAMAVRIKAI